jgi:hypothetical protein
VVLKRIPNRPHVDPKVAQKRADELRASYQAHLPPVRSAPTAEGVERAGHGAAKAAVPAGAAVDQTPPTAAEVKAAAKVAAAAWTQRLGTWALFGWLALAVGSWLLVLIQAPHKYAWALALTLIVVTFGLVVLYLAHREEGGFLQPLQGADGRLSTSYVQGGLWTILLTIAFGFFAAQLAFGASVDDFKQAFAAFIPSYLLLLGGPFAAVAAMRLNYGVRQGDGTIQKTDALGMQLKDIVSDDAGRTSLNDSQFFLFNLVAALAFIVMLIRDPTTLPVLPETLIGLTSLAALTYVTTKAVSNQRPVISTIVAATPDGMAGTKITDDTAVDIRGANFVVPGADDVHDLAEVRVRFGTIEVGVEGKRPDGTLNPTANSIYVVVPHLTLAQPGHVDVVVVTATGVQSEKYPLPVAPPHEEAARKAAAAKKAAARRAVQRDDGPPNNAP